MLKPIKSLLTYLHKNSNGSNGVGVTNGIGTMEETSLDTNSAMDGAEETPCEDPLYDPLALDGEEDVLGACDGAGNVERIDLNSSICSTVSSVTAETANTSCSDLDSSAGQIILVDVTSLKQGSELARVTGEPAVTISVNGLDDSGMSLENGHNSDETKSTNLEDDSFTTASCGDTPIVTVTDLVVPEECPDVADRSNAEETDPIATSSTNTQEPEEEEASDGSDSGLGSEPSRNLSTLEKEITELPPVKSNLKRRSAEETTGASNEKRPKKGITFDGVTVYYFSRMQGFGCVPSQGGCTLGMEIQHMHSRRFTLAEHAAEQRKMHRAQLQELNPRSSSSEETDSDEEPSCDSGSEGECESYGFLQPVTARQRRALLKAAGVRQIDSSEKDECRLIRTSREVCGCTCRGYCDPDTCACSQAGIKCQVDRPNFPCGCTQDGCANVMGRVEFNPARVRTHFIHTIMRLNLDNKTNGDTDGGMAMGANGGYGSLKDWSSGPVRLPGLYGRLAVNGGADTVDGYHHHQHHQAHHQMQHQYALAGHNYLGNHSVPQGTDSLDLHYAFRDYYSSNQPTDQLPMNNALMAPYYGNYPTSLEQYHQPHHSSLILDHHQQRQQDPHSTIYHGQMVECLPGTSTSNTNTTVIMDEDTTLNTPINPNFVCDETLLCSSTSNLVDHGLSQTDPLNTSSSCPEKVIIPETSEPLPETSPLDTGGDFIDLNTPLAPSSERLEAINDLLASSRHSIGIVKQSIIAEEDDELSDFRDPPQIPITHAAESNNTLTETNDTQPLDVPKSTATTLGTPILQDTHSDPTKVAEVPEQVAPSAVIETTEHLSEIIKNSIVETVSN
ncbi:uncharacterized protein LOC129746945 [Uranotaenia lowii]|uniref:uncharacterized protein LOC129746945 n=1 Tax=Uranotaenia lowii TaxID=190385 RepID=UPI00247929AB|nr:uncharacterized protein LOC129746945 [Uranotaenia lowii]XP_055596878.1 uncharacterized protein LOC129746945 [Uranotaenia lowii]XP_055596879.1 uncharacterized protein LOC129746945 [Uranotaenia lowii]XP_055596880.1 uncharacterized protein LOC129746945 [Uranotaenia lowii]